MPSTPKPTQKPSATTGPKMEGLDHADPHPAEEGDPYDAHNPGVPKPAAKDIGPNPAAHDGTPPPRPDNASTKP